MSQLNTPLKRVGFIVMLFGLLVLVIGLFQIAGSTHRLDDIFSNWIESVFFERYSFRRYPVACYGTWVALIGLLLSFLYDKTLGRLAGWIRAGRRAAPEIAAKPLEFHFKDAKSALEYSCEYLDTKLKEGEFTPCVVVAVSSSKESGVFAVIDIPTDAGIKRGIAAFSTSVAPPAVAGKLCAAMIGPALELGGAPTFFVFAELEPTWSDGSWKIKRRF